MIYSAKMQDVVVNWTILEQTSWVLFLKYLDDLETDKATAAELMGEEYAPIIESKYQWAAWAAPKDDSGKLDHHNAATGDDLADFVNIELFPYLKKFKTNAEDANTIQYKIGEIFSELKNRVQSGYNLREVINRVDDSLIPVLMLKKMRLATCMNPKYKTWAMQEGMEENITLHVLLSLP